MMKKISIAIFIAVIFLGVAKIASQSHWGKEIARNLLMESLEDSGFSVNLEKIEGTFPSAIVLKNVQLESDQLSISIESVDASLSLFGLLKKELTFSELKANGITFQQKENATGVELSFKKEIPFAIKIAHFEMKDVLIPNFFKADFEGRFFLKGKNHLLLDMTVRSSSVPDTSARIVVKHRKQGILAIRGDLKAPKWGVIEHPIELKLAANVRLNQQEASLKIHSNLPLVDASVTLQREEQILKGKAIVRSPSFFKARNIGTNTTFSWDGTTFQGNSVISGEFLSKIWAGKTDFSWKKGGSFFFPEWDLLAASIDLKGGLEITADQQLIGKVALQVGNLQDLSSDCYGSLKATSQWKEGREVEIDGKISNFYWKEIFCESVSFYSDLKNLFQKPEGNIYLDAALFKWHSLFLETAGLSIESNEEGLFPFKLFTEGEWTHPLELHLDGLFDYKSPEILCTLQNGTGSFFKHPLKLSHPVNLTVGPDLFVLSDFDLNLSKAHLFAHLDRKKEDTTAQLILENFPLDVLSLNPLDLEIQGTTNIQIDLKEVDRQLKGDFTATLSGLEIASLENKEPLVAEGTFQGHFNKERLDFKGGLTMKEAPLLSCALSLPIHLEIWPFEARALYHKNVHGDLIFNGDIEEVLDFFNLGTHHVSGKCSCNFHLSHTLDEPELNGYCHIENGSYENYFTGSQIHQIQADWRGDKETLFLESMTGVDGQKKGKFHARGEISLRPTELFPFHFDIDFQRFSSVQIDLVTADTSGLFQIEGNLHRATASGTLEVIEGDLLIPKRIPHSFPNLEVVYLNANKPITPPPLAPLAFYPLDLNISVHAPDSIFIAGRGLDSEWKGDFQIDGTNTAISAKGKLELIKGYFIISGRSFKLTEGILSFTGRPEEMPYLNLAATMDVKDISIIARLKGPLNDPQITLQSTPPLPLSTIMAYLLFGQNLAEINSYQALQLANSLASLVGEGPDILENTRRSLGVDRLNIITTPSKDDEVGDKIAVQVGKYISEGILVSFSQGAEESSTNISIEIELKNGFVVQLESDQQQEQGKFTLKWNHNY